MLCRLPCEAAYFFGFHFCIEEGPSMNRKLIVAILVIAGVPV